jgi:hypothetical protein
MVLDDHHEMIQELHSLSRRDLAPLRLVSNVLKNVSNLVERNVKALSPGGGGPEWINKWKEKDIKLQKLILPRLARANQLGVWSKPVGSIELYYREKENAGPGPARGPARMSTHSKQKYAPTIPSCTCNKPKKTPPIPSSCNGFEFEIVKAIKNLDRVSLWTLKLQNFADH